MKYLDRLQPLALAIMRLVLGVVMLAHGSPKLFGGLHNFTHFVASLGLPGWLGYITAVVEVLGAIMVLAGFFTRPAAFAICIDLLVAIWKVHLHNGLTGAPGRPGMELPLALAALAFGLIFFGAGPIALDHVLRGGGTGFKR